MTSKRVRGRQRQRLRHLLIAERGATCERCGRFCMPNELNMHHTVPVAQSDADPFFDVNSNTDWRTIAELLCIECHSIEHGGKQRIGADGWPVNG